MPSCPRWDQNPPHVQRTRLAMVDAMDRARHPVIDVTPNGAHAHAPPSPYQNGAIPLAPAAPQLAARDERPFTAALELALARIRRGDECTEEVMIATAKCARALVAELDR